jgi:hypothetical protein
MAYKTFIAGEEALASDVNSLLMSQTVARFASAAARSSALTSPVLNQLSMRDDNPGRTECWNGSAWVDAGRRIGISASCPSLAWGITENKPIPWSVEALDTDGFGNGSGTLTVPAGLGGVYGITVVIVPAGPVSAASVTTLVVGAVLLQAQTWVGSVYALTLSAVWDIAAGGTVVVNLQSNHNALLNYTAQIRLWRLGI